MRSYGDNLIATGAFVLLLYSVGNAYIVPPDGEVQNWAKARATRHEALSRKIIEIDNSYEVVFIPGILGSKLKIGDFTYGDDEILGRNLIFDPKQTVEATMLNSFNAHVRVAFRLVHFERKVDIYGSGIELLTSAVGGRKVYEFPYDWRNDIDKIADQFQNYAEHNLKGKRVLIVAHSMGGLVAWRWKNKYNEKAKPFKTVALVLLGVPLQGSCEVARMLVEGYGPPEAKSSFEKWSTHLVFDKAHPAIFTFPSVFQLLPRYDKSRACIKIKRGNNYYPFDHHEADAWLGREDYNLVRTFLKDTGLDESSYIERVKAAVTAGKQFRLDLDPLQYNDQVYLLYSDSLPMVETYSISASDNKWLRLESNQPNTNKNSDGRVLDKSATHYGYFVPTLGSLWPLENEHGELLSDDKFGAFVDKVATSVITHAKNLELLAFASADPELRREIESQGWIADPIVPKSLEGELSTSLRQIAIYNSSLVAAGEQNLASVAIETGRKMEPVGAKGEVTSQERVAAALYESAKIITGDQIDSRTLNRLGFIRLRQGRADLATDVLLTAATRANSGSDPFLTADIKSKIYINLSVALEKTGANKTVVQTVKTCGNEWRCDVALEKAYVATGLSAKKFQTDRELWAVNREPPSSRVSKVAKGSPS
jgi:pimeloyl-ACP methyl ester carboxylesterase